MAEDYTAKVDYMLKINGSYENTLDIEGFAQMMKDPSYCYKFYWLEAIVDLISRGVKETTFGEIIDEMIANAWYCVREYDKELKQAKEQLTNMVPYRALAGFFTKCEERVDWGSVRRLTEYIRRVDQMVTALPYTLGESGRLKKEVYFHPAWIRMIQDNTVNILGWIQYEKVKWLQNNNPEVPGLVYKLAPADEKMRKLSNVRKLWEGILEVHEVRDVFTGKPVISKKYDVDHFIPWSFVMNDELWNLMPMDSSLNSSKSNRLPKWNPFFRIFAENQYLMYRMIHEQPKIYDRFEACYRDNLHSIWAVRELYRKGNSQERFCNILRENMRPVYDSARRQGYEVWEMGTPVREDIYEYMANN